MSNDSQQVQTDTHNWGQKQKMYLFKMNMMNKCARGKNVYTNVEIAINTLTQSKHMMSIVQNVNLLGGLEEYADKLLFRFKNGSTYFYGFGRGFLQA